MKTPILETARLILRPMTVKDAETVYINWTSDPDISKFMRWETHSDVSFTRAWLASEEVLIEDDSIYDWGFVLKQTGELIGSGGLCYKDGTGMYELGYCIMKKHWNQGLTTEAARKIIDFGIQKLHQKRFYCCHAKHNPASGKVMTKVGFQYQNDNVYESWSRTKKFEAKEYLLEIK